MNKSLQGEMGTGQSTMTSHSEQLGGEEEGREGQGEGEGEDMIEGK